MTNERKNRDTLSSAIAVTEDISRTINRIHDMLWNLMNNPGNMSNIKNSIDNLYNKIKTLKSIKLDVPLVEQEAIVVPDVNDASPKADPDYSTLVNSDNPIADEPEPEPKVEEEPEPELEEEPEPELEEEKMDAPEEEDIPEEIEEKQTPPRRRKPPSRPPRRPKYSKRAKQPTTNKN